MKLLHQLGPHSLEEGWQTDRRRHSGDSDRCFELSGQAHVQCLSTIHFRRLRGSSDWLLGVFLRAFRVEATLHIPCLGIPLVSDNPSSVGLFEATFVSTLPIQGCWALLLRGNGQRQLQQHQIPVARCQNHDQSTERFYLNLLELFSISKPLCYHQYAVLWSRLSIFLRSS
jgi:hypothetical protein